MIIVLKIYNSRKAMLAALAAMAAVVALGAQVHMSSADATSSATEAGNSPPTYSVLSGSSAAPLATAVPQSEFAVGVAVQHPERGIDVAGARLLRGVTAPSAGATALAVVPAKTAPCLYVARAKSEHLSCGTTLGETALVTYDGAIGIVPDSVKSVTFTLTDGAQQEAPVINNVWQSPLEANKVSFTLNGTDHAIDLLAHSSIPAGAPFAN